MPLRYDIAGSQINGARDYQEDSFLITHLNDGNVAAAGSIVIVADGMGGHAAGNVASNLAVQSCNKFLTSHYAQGQIPKLMRKCVDQGNDAIAATVRETAALKGMGCTLVAAVFNQAGLYWASVGDSHLYLVRNGKLAKKNLNHNYGAYLDRMASAGKPVEPEPGLTRNMLLSALTGDPIAEVDCPDAPLSLMTGDRVLVCTDGLDGLAAQQIAKICTETPSAKDCVDKLLAAIDEKRVPRQDNTTVVAIDALADAGPKEPIAVAAPAQPEFPVELAVAPKSSYFLPIAAVIAITAAIVTFLFWPLAPKPTTPLSTPAPTATPQAAATNTPSPTQAPTPISTPTPTQEQAIPTNAAPAQTTPIRDTLRAGGTGPELIEIPAGSFQMGNPRPGGDRDEQPAHAVKLRQFAIMRYEVTVADYSRYTKTAGNAKHPVVRVSWDDANRYAQWLSDQTGKKYRLPTESEWEYAASAGSTSLYWWGYQIGTDNALCYGCARGAPPAGPTEVDSYKPNPFGLYDTAGNAYEWVQDCYNDSYTNAPVSGGAWLTGDCNVRIARGGAFSSPAKTLRTTKRTRFDPKHGYDDVGFRLVREP
jgi:formylglycine-generating enzyme required for sulfatase activity/serine/threonine protein phosphatase PrpC